jgi:hypothetical protein
MQQLRNWQREYRAKIQQLESQLTAEEPVSVSTFTDEIEASFRFAWSTVYLSKYLVPVYLSESVKPERWRTNNISLSTSNCS